MPLSSGNLREYFREALGNAMGESMVHLTDKCQIYLVNLLSEFTRSEHVFSGTDYGENPTLVLMLSRAQEAEPNEAIRIYKHLGDSSLYLSGFFNESVEGRAVSLNYYQSMGESAYSSVAGKIRHTEASGSALFMELAERFGDLVNLFNAMSFHGAKAANANEEMGDREIYDLVQRYRRTGNSEILKVLRDAGVDPDTGFTQPNLAVGDKIIH